MLPPNSTSTQSGKKRWLILAIVFCAQLAFAIIMMSVPPVLNMAITDLGISHTQAGLLMGIFALPGVFLSLAVGSLGDRYGAKYLALISLALMVLGTVFSALSQSFPLILAGRFISGLGAVGILVILPQFLSQWFLGKEIGIAMGVYNTVVPVGGLISFNFIPLLTVPFGWRVSFWMGATMSFVALVLFLIFYSAPPSPSSRPVSGAVTARTSPLRAMLNLGLPIWLVALSWMWFNAGFVAFTTFAPDFFVRHGGLPPHFADTLTGLIMWGSFFLSTVVGMLIQKYHTQKLFIILGNIIGAAAVAMSFGAQGNILVGVMLFAGIGVALIPSSIFSLPAFLVDPKRLGLAFGMVSTLVNVAILGGPPLVGWIRDATGSYLASFVVIILFLMLSVVSVAGLRIPRQSRV